MRKILIIFFMLLSCQTFSQVQEFILKNGLKVLVKEDHRAPIAVSMVWYNVGSSDEPGGITGVSHAIEHMMFKGTKKYPPGSFSKIIAAQGGQDNAFTNNDYTAYFEKLDAQRLPISFELEADRMRNLQLSAEEFAKEIKVIREERRSRTDDNPQALAFERFLATAHLAAPYNHPVIGWMSDLYQMRVDDLTKWYQKYYAPNNATLVVVGDVNPQKVYALAKRYFEPIPSRPLEARKQHKEPPALGEKNLVIYGPTQTPLVLVGFTVPSLTNAKVSWEPYALEVISSILGAGDSARFGKRLIREKNLASGVDVYYNLYSKYQTQFIVYGFPSQGHSAKALKESLIDELDTLKTTLVDMKELQRVKHQIIAQKTYEKDSIFGQATELGLLETVGLGWKKTEQYNQGILSITPEQVQTAAQHYFQAKSMTTAELKPLKEKVKQ